MQMHPGPQDAFEKQGAGEHALAEHSDGIARIAHITMYRNPVVASKITINLSIYILSPHLF